VELFFLVVPLGAEVVDHVVIVVECLEEPEKKGPINK
jgi:hypothetical protein